MTSGSGDRPLSPRHPGRRPDGQRQRPPEGGQGTGRRPKAGKAEPPGGAFLAALDGPEPEAPRGPDNGPCPPARRAGGHARRPRPAPRADRRRPAPRRTAPHRPSLRDLAAHRAHSRRPGSRPVRRERASPLVVRRVRPGVMVRHGATMARKPAPEGLACPMVAGGPSPPGRQGSATHAPPGGSAFLASACGRPLTALWWHSPRRGLGRRPSLEVAAVRVRAFRVRLRAWPPGSLRRFPRR